MIGNIKTSTEAEIFPGFVAEFLLVYVLCMSKLAWTSDRDTIRENHSWKFLFILKSFKNWIIVLQIVLKFRIFSAFPRTPDWWADNGRILYTPLDFIAELAQVRVMEDMFIGTWLFTSIHILIVAGIRPANIQQTESSLTCASCATKASRNRASFKYTFRLANSFRLKPEEHKIIIEIICRLLQTERTCIMYFRYAPIDLFDTLYLLWLFKAVHEKLKHACPNCNQLMGRKSSLYR